MGYWTNLTLPYKTKYTIQGDKLKPLTEIQPANKGEERTDVSKSQIPHEHCIWKCY